MNTYFYRKCPMRPTKNQSILIKLTFRQNFYGFLSNFPGTILWPKSNQILSNMLSKIRMPFFKMKIQSNLIKNSIPHFYLLLYSFLYRNLTQSYQVLTVQSNSISMHFNTLFWLKFNKILSKIASYISIDF